MVRDYNRIPDFTRRLMPTIMDEVEEATKETYEHMIENWENDMDSQGRAWEPLAPATVRMKGHDDILFETGEMMDEAGWEVDADNMTAEIYVEDPKIIFHEFGTEKIPKRPVLGPTHPVLVGNIEDAIEQGIDRSHRNAAITSGVINLPSYRR